MMMNTRFKFGLPLLLLLAVLCSSPLAAEMGPDELVRATADKVLADVTAKKDELKKDPSGIYDLVQATVLPHFNFEAMTRSAMGRHWRKADDAQRERLVSEFREMLVRTYAVALLQYSGQTIQYLPMRPAREQDRALVPTKVSEGAGAPDIPIDYWLAHEGGEWKVFDVVIDGISLVSNYRSSFSSEIRRSGIDGLIQLLASRNKESQG